MGSLARSSTAVIETVDHSRRTALGVLGFDVPKIRRVGGAEAWCRNMLVSTLLWGRPLGRTERRYCAKVCAQAVCGKIWGLVERRSVFRGRGGEGGETSPKFSLNAVVGKGHFPEWMLNLRCAAEKNARVTAGGYDGRPEDVNILYVTWQYDVVNAEGTHVVLSRELQRGTGFDRRPAEGEKR